MPHRFIFGMKPMQSLIPVAEQGLMKQQFLEQICQHFHFRVNSTHHYYTLQLSKSNFPLKLKATTTERKKHLNKIFNM